MRTNELTWRSFARDQILMAVFWKGKGGGNLPHLYHQLLCITTNNTFSHVCIVIRTNKAALFFPYLKSF